VTSLAVVAPDGLGEVAAGSGLPALAAAIGDLLGTLRWPGGGAGLSDGDVVVVSSKVLSKAEGRVVRAADRERAITAETVRVVATRVHERGVTRIVENRQGIVMAAAGVDSSNTSPGTVLLLPEDPDASARRLRAAWAARFGRRLGVLVTDTLGRPWRFGVADVAIGAAGLLLVRDLRGSRDPHGNPLEMTVVAVADEIAAAAELVKGKTAGRPVAVVRGVGDLVTDEDGPGAAGLNRTGPDDMFSLGTAEALARGRREAREAGEAPPPAGPGAGGLRP
jgi:coenzyme F420-0:L-glutamate ligase/coenzyme F420-1:gamma-L-glutamate ligase